MSTLKIGQEAPDINLPNQDGKIIKLDNFKGKKVIVYFYPKDNTPGCTAEACGLRDSYTSLLSKGFEVVGISADSIDSHKKFSAKKQSAIYSFVRFILKCNKGIWSMGRKVEVR